MKVVFEQGVDGKEGGGEGGVRAVGLPGISRGVGSGEDEILAAGLDQEGFRFEPAYVHGAGLECRAVADQDERSIGCGGVYDGQTNTGEPFQPVLQLLGGRPLGGQSAGLDEDRIAGAGWGGELEWGAGGGREGDEQEQGEEPAQEQSEAVERRKRLRESHDGY
jgi:hypothetical protein